MKTLTERLDFYVATMASHQRERLGGKLMIEARDELKRLANEIEYLRTKIGMQEIDRMRKIEVDQRGS